MNTPDPLVQARVQVESGQLERALATLENATAPLRLYAAHLLLADKQYVRGWQEYQSRLTRQHFRLKHPGKLLEKFESAPMNESVAVVGEQGIGDQLTFLRWLKYFGRCTLYVHPKLLPILPPLPHPVKPYRWEDDAPIDEPQALLLGDLPHLFQMDHIPAPITLRQGFITPAEFLATRIPDEIRIGIAWESGIPPGQQRGTLQNHKRVPLPLLVNFTNTLKCTLVNLQRNPTQGDTDYLRAYSTNPVFTPMASVYDELDTLLVQLQNLDSYIGVSSTTTHLLASLAIPASIFVPYPADFRFPPGHTSPWFPHFRVYHQDSRGDWAGAFALHASDARHVDADITRTGEP